MAKSMTAVACEHARANTDMSGKLGDIFVKSEGGSLVLFKRGQHIIGKHYGHPYWKEAKCHIIKIGPNKYELPTTPLV